MSYNDLLLHSCQYMYNNKDADGKQIISSDNLKTCENLFSDDFSSLNEETQDTILNSAENLYDPINGLYEKCKNQENKDLCLNTLLKQNIDDFGNKLLSNNKEVAQTIGHDIYSNLKKDIEANISNLKKYNTQFLEARTPLEKKDIRGRIDDEINHLNSNHDKLKTSIKDYTKKLMDKYRSVENTQYNDLVKNYKMIEINELLNSNLQDKLGFLKQKKTINKQKYDNSVFIYNILWYITIILILINSILLFLYYKK